MRRQGFLCGVELLPPKLLIGLLNIRELLSSRWGIVEVGGGEALFLFIAFSEQLVDIAYFLSYFLSLKLRELYIIFGFFDLFLLLLNVVQRYFLNFGGPERGLVVWNHVIGDFLFDHAKGPWLVDHRHRYLRSFIPCIGGSLEIQFVPLLFLDFIDDVFEFVIAFAESLSFRIFCFLQFFVELDVKRIF